MTRSRTRRSPVRSLTSVGQSARTRRGSKPYGLTAKSDHCWVDNARTITRDANGVAFVVSTRDPGTRRQNVSASTEAYTGLFSLHVPVNSATHR